MAFLPPTPVPRAHHALSVRLSPLSQPLRPRHTPTPSPRVTRCALPPHEYSSMASPATTADLTLLSAEVIAVQPVCRAQDHVQVTLSVGPAFMHTNPGQFVQLRRAPSVLPWRSAALSFATIASPPSNTGVFDVLVNRRNDPLKLAALRVGDSVRVSNVLGKGLRWAHVTETRADLHIFADAPQGFAAAKSLIEWGKFRAMSGEGANRKNRITVYYSIPHGRSLPYADRLSAWSVYGVNVVPLAGKSVLEYLSEPSGLGRQDSSLTEAFAMACVASEDTFESLFSMLVLYGFRRKAVEKLTQEVVEREVRSFDEGEEFDVGENKRPMGMPEEAYRRMKRDEVEGQVWQSWVHVREGMRQEFERKWAAQARMQRENQRNEEEKQNAWASWCARNKEQWTKVSWDRDLWGAYWNSWNDTNDKWKAKGPWETAGGNKYGQNGYAWDQQNAKEYWDGVSQGNGPRQSTGSAYDTGRRYQQWQGSSYDWNANRRRWSGYQQGGYRYEHEETSGGSSRSTGGSSAGGSGSGWSGWKRQQGGGSWRGTSSGSKRSWGGTGARQSTYGDLDFYGVLGIESGASRADIKRAYRRKAMEHHPDRNPERSEEAHVMMKQIVVAWSVLKDEDKRRKYDTYGPGGL